MSSCELRPQIIPQQKVVHIPFVEFYQDIPKACVIYDKYKKEYNDEYANWLGRWVKKAERCTIETCHASDNQKQEISDKLIRKLVFQILVSPYDRAPFVANTDKCPVLFKGFIFPYWMLEDIFRLLGCRNGMDHAKPHQLMIDMLEWANSLQQCAKLIPSESRALVPVGIGGELVVANQSALPTHLDSALLVRFNFAEHPELAIIKLLTYRDLIKNAFKEMQIRKKNKEIKKIHKQIVRFGEEQKALAEQEKTQNVQVRAIHEQAIKKQFEDISQIHASTQNIMEEHFQNLIEQMNQAEERMKKLQQECKNREAQIQALLVAQKNLQ